LLVHAIYPLHESSPIIPVLLAAESDTKNELGMYNKTYQTSMRQQGDLLQAINPLQELFPIVPLLFSHIDTAESSSVPSRMPMVVVHYTEANNRN